MIAPMLHPTLRVQILAGLAFGLAGASALGQLAKAPGSDKTSAPPAQGAADLRRPDGVVGGAPAGGSGAAGSVGKRSVGHANQQWMDRHTRFGGTEWFTRARQDSPLGFTLAIEVEEIVAKGGARVKAGDTLIRGRDGEMVAALNVQVARAENETEVETAMAAQELAQIRFDAVEVAKKEGVHNLAEYEERRVQLVSSKIAVMAARKRLEEEKLKTVQLREQTKRYRIVAPYDGIVDQVACEVGQTATENQPVMRFVDIDALWIDVPLRISETISLGLKAGHPAWVLLDLPGPATVLDAKVLYVAPAADASSGTRRVRVEAANPEHKPPGTAVSVRFTPPATDWNKIETESAPAMDKSASTVVAPTGAGGDRK